MNNKIHKRNSNFEILRIIAMLMIVISHFGCHGFGDITKDFTFNKIPRGKPRGILHPTYSIK